MSENQTNYTIGEHAVKLYVIGGLVLMVACFLVVYCRYIRDGIGEETQSSSSGSESDPSGPDLEKNEIRELSTLDMNIDCSVCLDTSEKDESVVILTLCGHKYHKNCIHNLNTCPMCRAIISNDCQQSL